MSIPIPIFPKHKQWDVEIKSVIFKTYTTIKNTSVDKILQTFIAEKRKDSGVKVV